MTITWPHVLVVTRDLPDGFIGPPEREQHEWDIEFPPGHTCGWQECNEDHPYPCVPGCTCGASDPARCEDPDPEQDEEHEWHGVTHTWSHAWGWTVPYGGCVVSECSDDSAGDIAYERGVGRYPVDDEWVDEHDCILMVVDA